MTTYRKTLPALALAAALSAAAPAQAGPLDEAFAPRVVPGLELASLDVPVRRKASPAPEKAAPVAEQAPTLLHGSPPAPDAEKGLWERTKEFFGL